MSTPILSSTPTSLNRSSSASHRMDQSPIRSPINMLISGAVRESLSRDNSDTISLATNKGMQERKAQVDFCGGRAVLLKKIREGLSENVREVQKLLKEIVSDEVKKDELIPKLLSYPAIVTATKQQLDKFETPDFRAVLNLFSEIIQSRALSDNSSSQQSRSDDWAQNAISLLNRRVQEAAAPVVNVHFAILQEMSRTAARKDLPADPVSKSEVALDPFAVLQQMSRAARLPASAEGVEAIRPPLSSSQVAAGKNISYLKLPSWLDS